VNETGLIIAEVAFLILLYAFVWSIVRSSSRQLRSAQPPPPAPSAPEPARAAAPVAAAPVAAPPVAAPLPAREPTDEPFFVAPTVVPDAVEPSEAADESGRFDLAANLDPRLVVEASPALEVGRVIQLEGGVAIGRSEAAEVSIADDQFVSHMHARIVRRGAYHWVQDLGSTNGTFLNDRRIDSDAQLKVHDALRIGQTVLRYQE
jgi:hypothetical protein